jgi:hypothetical protein
MPPFDAVGRASISASARPRSSGSVNACLRFFERLVTRADRFGEAFLIELGRLRLPPARRDVFRGDSDRLDAGFYEGERRGGGRAQGLEADLLQGVSEEPALELNPVFGGAFAGLEFVQGSFVAVDEGLVIDH